MRLLFSASILALALALASAGAANAVELTLIGPGGIRQAATEIIAGFEKKTGNTVKATFGSGGGTKARVVKGEPFDVPIVQPPYQDVIASGHVVAASETPVANVSVGLAVRAGAPKPDISNADALKKLLLSAKAIAYPDAANGAGAGVSFDETLKKLGVYDQVQAKRKPAQGGAGAMALLAKGEIDIGFTYVSEILPEPGVEAVGPLPKDISPPTYLIGFLGTGSKNPDAAKALIAYLTGPEAAAVYKARGMQPGK
jgi:molybdate transport system substrate-binding protein